MKQYISDKEYFHSSDTAYIVSLLQFIFELCCIHNIRQTIPKSFKYILSITRVSADSSFFKVLLRKGIVTFFLFVAFKQCFTRPWTKKQWENGCSHIWLGKADTSTPEAAVLQRIWKFVLIKDKGTKVQVLWSETQKKDIFW